MEILEQELYPFLQEKIPESSELWNLTGEEIRILIKALKIRLREHREFQKSGIR